MGFMKAFRLPGRSRNPDSKEFVQRKLLEKVSETLLWQQVCEELFQRDYNPIGDEIRQFWSHKTPLKNDDFKPFLRFSGVIAHPLHIQHPVDLLYHALPDRTNY